MASITREANARTLVERLVRESFGEEFVPDLVMVEGLFCGKTFARRLEGIEGIGLSREKFMILRYWERVGIFTSQDGSKLVVRPEYKEQAKKYADAYEQTTGKTVELILMES